MSPVYIAAALAACAVVALVVLRRQHAPAWDTGLTVGVVAHIVDDTTAPLIRQLGASAVRVSVYPDGSRLDSVMRALAEGFPAVIVEPNGDYTGLPEPNWTGALLIQHGNESDAKGVAPEAVDLGVGISSAVTDAWLAAYVQRYPNTGAVPLCIQGYGVPEVGGLSAAVERAKRALDAAGKSRVPIWVTECGVTWDRPVSELRDALAYLASEPRVQRAFVYALVDDTEHYGLVRNGTPTPMFQLVQAFNRRAGAKR